MGRGGEPAEGGGPPPDLLAWSSVALLTELYGLTRGDQIGATLFAWRAARWWRGRP